MRHRLEWFIHLQAQSLSKGDEHPAYTSHGVRHSLHLFYQCAAVKYRKQMTENLLVLDPESFDPEDVKQVTGQ